MQAPQVQNSHSSQRPISFSNTQPQPSTGSVYRYSNFGPMRGTLDVVHRPISEREVVSVRKGSRYVYEGVINDLQQALNEIPLWVEEFDIRCDIPRGRVFDFTRFTGLKQLIVKSNAGHLSVLSTLNSITIGNETRNVRELLTTGIRNLPIQPRPEIRNNANRGPAGISLVSIIINTITACVVLHFFYLLILQSYPDLLESGIIS